MKKKKNKTLKLRKMFIDEGSVESFLDELKRNGITDLSKAKITWDYERCNCEDYCRCPDMYSNIRVEWFAEE